MNLMQQKKEGETWRRWWKNSGKKKAKKGRWTHDSKTREVETQFYNTYTYSYFYQLH